MFRKLALQPLVLAQINTPCNRFYGSIFKLQVPVGGFMFRCVTSHDFVTEFYTPRLGDVVTDVITDAFQLVFPDSCDAHAYRHKYDEYRPTIHMQ